MKEFFKTTFTKPKLQKLFVSTALGNFAGYVAGSLVTVLSTYHSVERRAIRNLFGILPRKQVVVHVLPEWLEWLLALIVGFLVMEFVRYVINNEKYEAMTAATPREGTPYPTPVSREPKSLDPNA
jgi:hypothetical protein